MVSVLTILWICRMAVALVFPMFMFSVVIIRSVILFKRGAIRNKEVHLISAPRAFGLLTTLDR
jgi:hypothetical protein